MAKNVFQNLTALINSIFDVISQGSLERIRLVREFNRAFSEAYLTGEFDRMCKVSIAVGDSSFRHSMSTFVLRSGFKITIQNDEKLTSFDIQEIFVRQLMALGFDTLIIIGKNMSAGVKLQLSNFSNPNQYFLH
jgi:hypothetical protein